MKGVAVALIRSARRVQRGVGRCLYALSQFNVLAPCVFASLFDAPRIIPATIAQVRDDCKIHEPI